MQILIIENIIKTSRTSIENCVTYLCIILNILHVSRYYVHSVQFCNFTSPVDAEKSASLSRISTAVK